MQRLAWVGRLKPECVQQYIDLHANTWPSVLERNTDCNLRNYSIFYKLDPDGSHLLFSYVEYVGDDLAADMQRMADDPEIQRWWADCKPCFETIENLPPGEVWAPMRQVFFQQ